MAEKVGQLDWLDKVFSTPGAVIVVCIAIVVVSCLLAFSTGFRDLIKSRRIRWGSGDKQFEMGPIDQQAQKPFVENGTAAVKPPPPMDEENEKPNLDYKQPEDDQLPLQDESEGSLVRQMYIAAYREQDSDKIEIAYQGLKSWQDREMSDESLETLRSELRLKTGVQSGESELKELEQQNPTWTQPSFALVQYYQQLSRFDLARPHAQKAIEQSENDFIKAYAYTVMADILIQLESQADALSLLDNALSEVAENEAKALILDKIADIHKAANDKLMAAKALEHALKLVPSSKERRFNLAYLYNEQGRHLLALFHYRILSDQDARFSSTLNNLGIVYETLKLPGKCVEVWKRAANWGETYPMGNLAINLIEHGFYDEARNVLDRVPSGQRQDPRVMTAIKQIDSTIEREEKELDKYLAAMKVHHKYMLIAVDAEQNPELRQVALDDLVGNWVSSSGAKLEISLSEGGGLLGSSKLKAVLTESVPTSALGGLFGYASSPSQEKFDLYFTKNGLVLTGFGHAINQQRASTILGGGSETRNYFMVIESKTNIRGLYWTDNTNTHEISFNRS